VRHGTRRQCEEVHFNHACSQQEARVRGSNDSDDSDDGSRAAAAATSDAPTTSSELRKPPLDFTRIVRRLIANFSTVCVEYVNCDTSLQFCEATSRKYVMCTGSTPAAASLAPRRSQRAQSNTILRKCACTPRKRARRQRRAGALAMTLTSQRHSATHTARQTAHRKERHGKHALLTRRW
jgi:hypothetical protein